MRKKNIGSNFDDFLTENAMLGENDTSPTLTTLASAAVVLGNTLTVEFAAGGRQCVAAPLSLGSMALLMWVFISGGVSC